MQMIEFDFNKRRAMYEKLPMEEANLKVFTKVCPSVAFFQIGS